MDKSTDKFNMVPLSMEDKHVISSGPANKSMKSSKFVSLKLIALQYLIQVQQQVSAPSAGTYCKW